MKHLPERHQSIVPPPSVLLAFAAVFVLMAVIWVVVAMAAD
jgi:hypothetical protein